MVVFALLPTVKKSERFFHAVLTCLVAGGLVGVFCIGGALHKYVGVHILDFYPCFFGLHIFVIKSNRRFLKLLIK